LSAPSAEELLQRPDAVLNRSHLRELGWQRGAIDVIFRLCRVVAVPGYSRPHIFVRDYLELIKTWTYDDRRGDRVRP
jgi:hypothetical protein